MAASNDPDSKLRVSSVHEQPELLQAACRLLNSEWKRGESARLHSIERSEEELPCSLLLLGGGGDRVVGFARISAVMGVADAVLAESVVVDKELRGRGLGRAVMRAVESFAADREYGTVYLSTHDKEGFYAHLGYARCGPVSLQPPFAQGMSAAQMKTLASLFHVAPSPPSAQQPPTPAPTAAAAAQDQDVASACRTEAELPESAPAASADNFPVADVSVSSPAPPLPPPPPPPPPPPCLPPAPTASAGGTAKEPELPIVWMRKAVKAADS